MRRGWKEGRREWNEEGKEVVGGVEGGGSGRRGREEGR